VCGCIFMQGKIIKCRPYLLMDLSPSWGEPKSAATQEFPRNSWNPKVHYRVHKSPPPVSILSQINPIHTIPSYLRSILILSTHLRLGLPSGLFPSGFLTNILYAFLFFPLVLNTLSISSSSFRLCHLSKESVQVRGFLWSFVTSLFFMAKSC
jgi:hypothetical protein